MIPSSTRQFHFAIGIMFLFLARRYHGFAPAFGISRRAAHDPFRLFDTSPRSRISSGISSNEELVQRRISTQRAKRAAREASIQERTNRNLQLKKLLHIPNNTTTTQYQVPPLYAVKVWVDGELREELRLSAREKRGRVFLPEDSEGVRTLRGLKDEMHAFFSALKKDSYLVEATLPIVSADGSFLPPSEVDEGERPPVWPIESDEDVQTTFNRASTFYNDLLSGANATRPTVVINILKNPNAPSPPPPPAYLEDMANPDESPSMTMLSFYSFPPQGIDDPEDFAFQLRKRWKPFKALGRVYVATEGVNAQMSVPTNVLSNFMDCCKSLPPLEHMENGINIDPKPLLMEEFAVAGVPRNGKPSPPFRSLNVRVRTQIVADGLPSPLNWQAAGYDMPPMEWHNALQSAQKNNSSSEDVPIVLDCRNSYETDVGTFQGAEPLETTNFRDSWDILKDRLKDTPKDAPIMTFCTGGIRCVKVGAYLTQEMGFTNVSRLAGGIIAYDRTLSESAPKEDSLFKGTNFVFDGRLGRAITDDELGECVTCGSSTSLVSNCRNENCHIRMVQCESCRTGFLGTCSDACRQRIVNGNMLPRRSPALQVALPAVPQNLEEYSSTYSSPVPSFFKEIELNTKALFPSGAHMVSGEEQGRFLTHLASQTRSGRVLELGSFSGYATACFMEGAKVVGDVLGANGGSMAEGPCVVSMERDERAYGLAVEHLKVLAKHGISEAAAEAAANLRNKSFDVTDTRVSLTYNATAGCELLRVTDALATLEAMASGNSSYDFAPFDMVFVDADKTRLLEYVEACLGNDRILKRGGTIVVDNVLWKGLVLEAASGTFTSISDSEDSEKEEVRRNRRARKLSTLMHEFNTVIALDDRVEVHVLPVRDGLSIIRKK